MAVGDIKSFRVLGDEQIDPQSGIGANGSGWAAEVVLDGITSTVGTLDATQLTLVVEDPGFDTAGGAVTRTRTIKGSCYIRRQHPNQSAKLITTDGTDLTLLIALDDWVYSGSTIVSASITSTFYDGSTNHTAAAPVNESDLAYTKPIPGWINPQNDLTTGSFATEFVVFHRHAMLGQQVACVEFQATDGTNFSPEVLVSETSLSSLVTQGQIPEVWKATLDFSTLTQGVICTVNAKIYPWLGDNVFDTAVDGFAWPTPLPATPLRVLNDRTGGYGGGFAYVKVGAIGGTASGDAATARTTPYATLGAARSGLQSWRNTNKSLNNLGGGTVRLMDADGSDVTHTVSSSIGGTAGLTWWNIEKDPLATGVVTVTWSSQQEQPTLTRFRNLKVVQTGGTRTILGPNTTTSMVCVDGCELDCGSIGWFSFKYLYNSTTIRAIDIDALPPADAAVPVLAGMVANGGNVTGNNLNSAGVLVGCSYPTVQPITLLVIAKSDGKIVYNNRLGGGRYENTSVATTYTIGLALVQNVYEKVDGEFGCMSHFADGDRTTIVNLIDFHNTCAGERTSRMYCDNAVNKVAPYGTVKIGVAKYSIYDNYNIKTENFSSGAGSTGNWAYYFGVGNRGNISLFGSVNRTDDATPNIHGDNYLGAFWNASSEYNLQRPALGIGNPGVMDLFTNYTAAPRAVPAFGGDYRPLVTASPFKNRVPVDGNVLTYDFAGLPRKSDGTGAAGAYEIVGVAIKLPRQMDGGYPLSRPMNGGYAA
jgi:hypothetical protein